MFNFVRRWYDQNRNKLWAVIVVVALVLFFLNAINNYYINKMKEGSKTDNTNTVSKKETINNEITGELEGTTSLLSGTGVDTTQLEKQTKVIDEFFQYCNNGNIQNAYNLLTQECKEELFTTVESFENKYYANIFKTPKTYSLQNWIKNTYKVMIIDDPLVTGKVNKDNSYLQDYITIKSTDDGYKLNVNNYIGRTVKDKTQTIDNIEITVVKIETYMDYEEYTIKAKRLTTNQIKLDTGESTNTIYLLDENNLKEYVSTAEINYDNLKLIQGKEKESTFRFCNKYSTTRKFEYLVFEKVLINDGENSDYKKILINV